ncbi:helix-turn-helix domain-containing protein [Streptomyces sp. NPDC054838]
MAETLKKGSRVTGAARDKLAADLKKKYDSGASIRALAEETGRSYGFVHRMLSESGVNSPHSKFISPSSCSSSSYTNALSCYGA